MTDIHKATQIILLMLTWMANAIHATTNISLPPGTVEGFLHNGLHYIIKENSLPRHNVECRLVMRVGSIQEEADQKGAAHFLEHMAFNGSKHFPESSMIDYFQRQGMKYGRDINAFTGFDRTIYWFTLPIDKYTHNIVDTTLVAVNDILTSLTIDDETVRKERGIIMEELRSYNLNDPFYHLKNGYGRYAAHLPLGRETDIQHMETATLKAFYKQWYKPALATLIIVGNINAKETEQKIKNILSEIPSQQVQWTFYPQEYPQGLITMAQENEWMSHQKVELMILQQTIVISNIEQYVRNEHLRMVTQMLDKRLEAIKTSVSDQWYLADKNHLTFSIEAQNYQLLLNHVTQASAALQRLALNGPDKEELQWAIEKRISRLKAEPATKLSTSLCDDLIDYVITGDRHIYSDLEIAAIARQLTKTTKKQIKQMARLLLKASKRTILAAYQCPTDSANKLCKQTLQAAWHKGKAKDAPVFQVSHTVMQEQPPQLLIPQVLAKTHPSLDVVTQKHHYGELGLTELILKNGIHILMRPTLDDDSLIHISAFGRGGLGDIPVSQYAQLKDAVSYADMGGITTIGLDSLSQLMIQRGIMLNIGIDNYWHETMVTSKPHDAQLIMNLLYEKWHHPGQDRHSFEECRQDELNAWGKENNLSKMIKMDQAQMINNLVDSLLGNAIAAQFIPQQRKDIEELNLEYMTNFYRQVYTNPQGLYLLITGNFDTDTMSQLATNTFGRMVRPKQPLTQHNAITNIPKAFERQFPSADSVLVNCNYIFAGNYCPGLKQTLMFKLMRDVLQDRMLSRLRQKHNIVYSPFADVQYRGIPSRVVWFRLMIDVTSQNQSQLNEELIKILTELRTNPITEQELNSMKRSFVVTKRQALSDVSPAEWKNTLSTLLRNGETLNDYNNYDDILLSITPNDLRDAFVKYIDIKQLILLYQKQ